MAAKKGTEAKKGKSPQAKGKKPKKEKGAISEVKEGIEEVHEEVKDAVKETISAWRGLLRPKILITTGILLLILLAIIVLFKIHATINEDLVIILKPATKSLEVNHGQQEQVTFSLRTNNYLLCEASCTYQLRDLSTNEVLERDESVILKNSDTNLTLTFTAPEKGKGQQLYALEVECANQQRAFCAREGEMHKTSALITLDYGLTVNEIIAKARARERLPTFIEKVKTYDLLTQEYRFVAEALTTEGAPIETQETLFTTRDELISAARAAVNTWNAEAYQSIELPESVRTEEVSHAIASLHDIVIQQNALVMNIQEIADDTRLPVAARTLQLFSKNGLEGYLTALLRLGRRINEDPYNKVISRQEEVQRLTTSLEESIADATQLLKNTTLRLEGLIVQEAARLNSANGSTNSSSVNGTNNSVNRITAESIVEWARTFVEECTRLEMVMNNLTAQNLTASNESTQFLIDCTAFENQTLPSQAALRNLTLPQLALPPERNFTSNLTLTMEEPKSNCCVLNNCEECCEDGSCEKRPPVLFLHGHSLSERNAPAYSLEAFKAFQELLQEDGLYIDAGIITPYDTYLNQAPGVLGRSPLPVSVSATYYYDAYLSGDSYILSVEKSESIDTYAIRLKDIIDTLLLETGEKQVTLVVHSMGGLVARRYLRIFGRKKVDQLIMIGTPNHGVDASVASFCPVFGADKECEEMQSGSPFLARLNDPERQPWITQSVIMGKGCDMSGEQGDGVVTVASAKLTTATNVIVNGSCTSTVKLHTELLNPETHPEVYEKVKELLLQE